VPFTDCETVICRAASVLPDAVPIAVIHSPATTLVAVPLTSRVYAVDEFVLTAMVFGDAAAELDPAEARPPPVDVVIVKVSPETLDTVPMKPNPPLPRVRSVPQPDCCSMVTALAVTLLGIENVLEGLDPEGRALGAPPALRLLPVPAMRSETQTPFFRADAVAWCCSTIDVAEVHVIFDVVPEVEFTVAEEPLRPAMTPLTPGCRNP
jgi:hypothetical protein